MARAFDALESCAMSQSDIERFVTNLQSNDALRSEAEGLAKALKVG